MVGWDGPERRAALIADDRTRANGKTIDAPLYLVLVGFVAIILLQAAALVGHAHLASRQSQERDAADAARDQISCFLVGSVQGKPGSDLLTACGFIKIGGK